MKPRHAAVLALVLVSLLLSGCPTETQQKVSSQAVSTPASLGATSECDEIRSSPSKTAELVEEYKKCMAANPDVLKSVCGGCPTKCSVFMQCWNTSVVESINLGQNPPAK